MKGFFKMKLLVLLFLVSCGSSHEHSGDPPEPVYQPWPVVDGDGDGGGGGETPPIVGKPSYRQVDAIMVTYCDSCHGAAKFRESESGLRDSTTVQRVQARKMPPPGAKQLPEKERGLILSFF